MKATTILITAKCSDMCNVEIYDKDNNLVKAKDGYVPKFLGQCQSYSDYLVLKIDIATGKILNWDIQEYLLEDFLQEESNN